MNQSSVIIGALFVAFVVFITARGKLQKYLNLLVGSGESTSKQMDKAQADLEKKSDSESTGSVPPPAAGFGMGGAPVPFNQPGILPKGLPGIGSPGGLMPNFLNPRNLVPQL